MKKISPLLSLILFFMNAHSQVNQDWAKQFHSTFQLIDYGREVRVDNLGNVYVAGHSLVNAQQEGEITILKYDAAGNLLWQYHSATTDYIEDMLIDAGGNVFYAGSRWHDSTSEFNYLTGKLNSNGTLAWTSEYDGNGIGSGLDYGWGICADRNDNIFITGHSQGTFNGYDYVTVKYDSSGHELWNTRYENPDNIGLGSNYDNDAFDLETDDVGNVYVTGYNFNGTTHELSLIKYDASGNFMWAKDFDTKAKWPTTNINKTYIKIDKWNNIYLLGNVQEILSSTDMLLLKYDSAGNLTWFKKWNSPTNDSDYVSYDFYDDESLAIDDNGNVFIQGTTIQPGMQFKENIVTVKFDSSGTEMWHDIYNGAADDQDIAYGLAVDLAGNAYVCGSTSNAQMVIGSEDYITFKLNGLTGLHEWDQIFNGAVDFIDKPHAIAVDSSNNVYVTGISATNTDWSNLRAQIVTVKYSQTSAGVVTNIISNDISAYPNPANTYLNISINEAIHSGKIILYDNIGQIVYSNNFSDQNYFTINTSTMSEGIYDLVITVEKELRHMKVSISH